MASRLNQLRQKATQASQFISKYGSEYYKDFMHKNKKYIADPPTVEKCRELSKQLFYTRLASVPGRYEAFWKELEGAKEIWKKKKEIKVEELGIAALFGIELYAWFCAGEIIGRGFTLTGYRV